MELTEEQQAESLLVVTGLLRVPDRDDVVAARALYPELRKDLLGMLDREKQTPLRVNDLGVTYFKRLAATPPYRPIMVFLEQAVGLPIAGQYQTKHQVARQLLINSHPANTLDDPVFGTIEAPPDPFLLAQWMREADTVENQRLLKDVNAAAAMPETVAVFRTVFPATYTYLVGELKRELVNRQVAKWSPNIWQRTTIKVFLGNPIDVGAKPLPKPAPPPQRGKLDPSSLETATQQRPK